MVALESIGQTCKRVWRTQLNLTPEISSGNEGRNPSWPQCRKPEHTAAVGIRTSGRSGTSLSTWAGATHFSISSSTRITWAKEKASAEARTHPNPERPPHSRKRLRRGRTCDSETEDAMSLICSIARRRSSTCGNVCTDNGGSTRGWPRLSIVA